MANFVPTTIAKRAREPGTGVVRESPQGVTGTLEGGTGISATYSYGDLAIGRTPEKNRWPFVNYSMRRLLLGPVGQVLTSLGTDAAWQTINSGNVVLSEQFIVAASSAQSSVTTPNAVYLSQLLTGLLMNTATTGVPTVVANSPNSGFVLTMSPTLVPTWEAVGANENFISFVDVSVSLAVGFDSPYAWPNPEQTYLTITSRFGGNLIIAGMLNWSCNGTGAVNAGPTISLVLSGNPPTPLATLFYLNVNPSASTMMSTPFYYDMVSTIGVTYTFQLLLTAGIDPNKQVWINSPNTDGWTNPVWTSPVPAMASTMTVREVYVTV